jgi:transcriptional regulator with XRE-family HTH domain
MRKSAHTAEYAALRKELKTARLMAGLSQRELAQRLKVTHTWVAKVESGERRIDFIECCWFLQACDANPLRALQRAMKHLPAARNRQTSAGAR